MTQLKELVKALFGTSNLINVEAGASDANSLATTKSVRRSLLREFPAYRELRQAEDRLMFALRDAVPDSAYDATENRLRLTGGSSHKLHFCESSMVCEHTIFHYRPNGLNIVESCARDFPPPEGSLEALWLQGLLDSYYTIVLVRETIPHFGINTVDIFSGEERIVADLSASTARNYENKTLAVRLVPIDTYWFMTASSAAAIDDPAVLEQFRAYCNERFPDLTDVRRLSRHDSREFQTRLIQLIATVDSRAVIFSNGYVDPERWCELFLSQAGVEPPPSKTALPQRKIGRNERCPCGSGEKFKRCCGGGVR
jgi:SEC-C motif